MLQTYAHTRALMPTYKHTIRYQQSIAQTHAGIFAHDIGIHEYMCELIVPCIRLSQ